jgi:CheY-like chemotaxis protein
MSEATHTLQRELQHAQREIEELRQQLRHALAQTTHVREEARRRLAEFAREVRVPLTSVLGFTDLLSVNHTENSAELNQIVRAGRQLMDLVDSLEQSAQSADQADSDPAAAAPAELEKPAPAVRTVLHIEDNETNFRLIERILEDRANLNLLWASSAEEGMNAAAEHSPALILLDLNLPDSHGGELLGRLKSNPLTAAIPIIVLSADISPSQIERMLQAGARDYLTKPFEIKRLLCLVDEVLEPNVAAAAAA